MSDILDDHRVGQGDWFVVYEDEQLDNAALMQTLRSMKTEINNLKADMVVDREKYNKNFELLWELRLRNISAHILLFACQSQPRENRCTYFADMQSRQDVRLFALCSEYGLSVNRFAEQCDQLIYDRNTDSHFPSNVALDRSVDEVRKVVTDFPRLRVTCVFEFGIVEKYEDIKRLWGPNFGRSHSQ
jgi:hypothetical protein